MCSVVNLIHRVSKKSVLAVTALFAAVTLFAQQLSTQPHFAPVTQLAYNANTNSVFSAGEDGTVICWNAFDQGVHYRCSAMKIRLLSLHPTRNEIAFYETDDFGTYQVSVWDWTYKNKKYTKTYTDPVTCLSYSANGTYLMVGTSSTKGMNFYYADNGFQRNLLSSSTGAVTMAQTSGTESSLVVYSPVGQITYYDLKKGSEKARFSTVPNLTQTILYNNNMCLAGTDGEKTYSVDATTGAVIKSVRSVKPFLCTVASDSMIFYTDYASAKHTVRSLSTDSSNELQALAADAKATAVVKTPNGYYFGTETGDIYFLEKTEEYTLSRVEPITTPTYTLIDDIAVAPMGYGYLLTKDFVYKVDPDTGATEIFAENAGYTNISVSDTNLYLWSKESRTPIKSIDVTNYSAQTELTPVFTPSSSVQVLKLYENDILILEANGSISILDPKTNAVKNRYSGIGYLDAELINGKELYIGKSSATNPKVPLLLIDTATGETVTLNIKATAVFNFATDGTSLYGQLYSETASGKTSSIFTYRPTTRDYKVMWSVKEEVTSGFVSLIDNSLFSDLSQNELTALTPSSSFKRKVCELTGSIKNAALIGDKIFVLSERGTITAYKKGTYQPMGAYILSLDNRLKPVNEN